MRNNSQDSQKESLIHVEPSAQALSLYRNLQRYTNISLCRLFFSLGINTVKKIIRSPYDLTTEILLTQSRQRFWFVCRLSPVTFTRLRFRFRFEEINLSHGKTVKLWSNFFHIPNVDQVDVVVFNPQPVQPRKLRREICRNSCDKTMRSVNPLILLPGSIKINVNAKQNFINRGSKPPCKT